MDDCFFLIHMTIGIVDDQKLFRQSLCALLASNPDFQIVLECEHPRDYAAALDKMVAPPDINLLDMEMPELNGIELNRLLQVRHPGIKVLGLSVHAREAIVSRIIQGGASGYLVKNCDKEELFTAIHSVYHTGFYINQMVLKALQNANRNKQMPIIDAFGTQVDLTSREVDVLKLICQELNAGEIAKKLFISARTVEGHRNNLLLKTGCSNVAGLVLFAVKNNIVSIGI